MSITFSKNANRDSSSIMELSYSFLGKMKNSFRRLLETYNDCIGAAEADKSKVVAISPSFLSTLSLLKKGNQYFC